MSSKKETTYTWVDGRKMNSLSKKELDIILSSLNTFNLSPTQIWTWEMRIRDELVKRKNKKPVHVKRANTCSIKRIEKNGGNLRYAKNKVVIARVSKVLGREKKKWEAVIYENNQSAIFQTRIEAEIYIHKNLLGIPELELEISNEP